MRDSVELRHLFHLPHDCAGAPLNMALDCGLLRSCAAGGRALFRSYGWTEPAVSFGLSQRAVEVQALFGEEVSKLCFVRRPTGGGVVDHRSDWTYALALPAGLALARRAPVDIYRVVHECVAGAVVQCGGRAVLLAPCPRLCAETTVRGDVEVCFVQPVADDVVLRDGGAKVAGAAMKRTREGVLIQGSLQPQLIFPEATDTALQTAFFDVLTAGLAGVLELAIRKIGLGAEGLGALADPAEEARFASEAWTRRR